MVTCNTILVDYQTGKQYEIHSAESFDSGVTINANLRLIPKGKVEYKFDIGNKKFVDLNTNKKYYVEEVVFRDSKYMVILNNDIIVVPIKEDNEANVGSEESKRGEGMRYNKQKTPYECIPLHLISGAARVFKYVTEREEKPYPMWNWTNGMNWSVPYACMLRHLDAWYRGETNDSETNENHLHHVMCNLLMLIHYIDAFQEGDNRPKEFFQPGGMNT